MSDDFDGSDWDEEFVEIADEALHYFAVSEEHHVANLARESPDESADPGVSSDSPVPVASTSSKDDVQHNKAAITSSKDDENDDFDAMDASPSHASAAEAPVAVEAPAAAAAAPEALTDPAAVSQLNAKVKEYVASKKSKNTEKKCGIVCAVSETTRQYPCYARMWDKYI